MTFFIFLLIIGVLIIVHEFGHFIMAKRTGVKVERFSLGFGPRLLRKKKNDTEYCVSIVPLGGYVKLAGDTVEEFTGQPYEYYAKPPRTRSLIIVGGPVLNYILGVLCFCLISFVGYPMLTTKVGGVIDGYGAKDAGIMAGDRIVSVDGKKVEYWEDIQRIIQGKKDVVRVKVSLQRNGKEFTLDVKISQKKVDDQLGQKRSVGLLGIKPKENEIVKVKRGIGKSFLFGAYKAWDLTLLTYKALWRMITGKLSIRESVTGPLGVFYITYQAAQLGIIPLLYLVAALNISLAIFNLLPLPVLDGGHLLLLGIEMVRRKSLGAKAERIITQAGLTLIISLAVIVTYNDIVRLFGDKIAKFFGY